MPQYSTKVNSDPCRSISNPETSQNPLEEAIDKVATEKPFLIKGDPAENR